MKKEILTGVPINDLGTILKDYQLCKPLSLKAESDCSGTFTITVEFND